MKIIHIFKYNHIFFLFMNIFALFTGASENNALICIQSRIQRKLFERSDQPQSRAVCSLRDKFKC